jgi:hypothetical protein
MDVPGSSSGSSSKRGRKLRQCSGEIRFQPMDSLSSVELETITNKVVFVLFEFWIPGDSTKSDRTEASSESDFDPNGSFQKGESSRRRCERQKQSGLKFAALAYESNYDDGEHKSAFLPYRVTVLSILYWTKTLISPNYNSLLPAQNGPHQSSERKCPDRSSCCQPCAVELSSACWQRWNHQSWHRCW